MNDKMKDQRGQSPLVFCFVIGCLALMFHESFGMKRGDVSFASLKMKGLGIKMAFNFLFDATIKKLFTNY